MAQVHELARQQVRNRFNATRAREKMVRAEQNLHARNHAPAISRKEGRERILPGRRFKKTPSL
jgi:hypothetical protein